MSDVLQPSRVAGSDGGAAGGFDPDATALAAVDEAARAISSVLAVEEVLQLIVDRVRDLVAASYAALGIVAAWSLTGLVSLSLLWPIPGVVFFVAVLTVREWWLLRRSLSGVTVNRSLPSDVAEGRPAKLPRLVERVST